MFQRSTGAVIVEVALIVAGLLTACSSGVLRADDGEPGTKRSQPRTWASPFGIGSCHINNRSADDNARWMPKMVEIGLRSYRTPNAAWGTLERERGGWYWDVLDKQLDYLESNHFECGVTLMGNPQWNQLDPPGTLPVNNLKGWSNYVTRLAKHLKGRVHLYEVWNEPPNFTGRDQTPADYAKIVIASYEAVKAVDPDCLVGIAAKSAHVTYLEQVLLAGAKDHFDFISLHPYEILGGIAENAGSEAVFMNIAPVVRKMLVAQNPAKQNVPIVFTELGVDARMGVEVQASTLVKAYTMGIAQGIECIEWFEGRDGDSGPMGLIDGKGNPRPAYTAMATMIDQLGQRPRYVGWLMARSRHYLFVFDGANGPVGIAWSVPDGQGKINFGEEMTVIDPLTGKSTRTRNVQIGTTPILLRGISSRLVQKAAKNRTRPLPWGRTPPEGDYHLAREVSIEFGDSTREAGLHTRSGAHVAKAVVAYGGSARAGDVPGGNVFIVDPSFLSYTSEPIEITVTVRRNPKNENAGFKLVYESPEGFSTANGWYTIPDNKQWYTKSWRIDDPRFVNYWGYNFILESDGNVYNHYLIKSIKVRKLSRD